MTEEAKRTPGVAIASLVTGILGILSCCLFLSIPAIICGHVAKSRIKASPDTLTGDGFALAGLILGYVSLGLSIVLIPLNLAIAIPSFVKARNTAQCNACINNLRMIDMAKEQAALAERWTEDQAVDANVVNQYIKGNTTPVCPAGGTYTYGRMNEQPTCDFRGPPVHRLPGAE